MPGRRAGPRPGRCPQPARPCRSASSRGIRAEEAVGIAGGRPDARVAEQGLVEDHRQVVPERRHAADREAGGGAHLGGGGLAHLGHVEGVGSLSVSTRCSPEAMHTTGSPSATNTIDLAISACSQPTASAASPTVRVEDVEPSGPRRRVRARERPSITRLLHARAGLWPLARPMDRGESSTPASPASSASDSRRWSGQLVEVPEQVVVADEAEVDAAVVAEQRDPEALVACASGTIGKQVDHLAAHQVERELRARHVGHDQVEEALAGHQARGLPHHVGRREAGELGEHLGAHRLAALLEPLAAPRGRCRAGRPGSWHQTGSGAIIAATLLPSAPRSRSVRTLTGTIAFSSRPSVTLARCRRRWPRGRRPRWPARRR